MGWWRRSTGALLKRVISTSTPTLHSPWRRSKVSKYHTIQAIPREITGRRLAARERSMGRIPAVVFTSENGSAGVSSKLLLTTSGEEIQSLMKQVPSFCSTKFGLNVSAGCGSSVVIQSGTVLPVKVHRDSEGQLLNLVLQWMEEGSEVKVDVPVAYKGEDVCPGLQKGGYLHKMKSTLGYLCPTENIPPTIEVDLTNLDIGDKVLLRDLPVHSSLKCLIKNDKLPICKLLAARPTEPTKTV